MFHDIAGHEDLTEGIIACALRVHEAWGPGLLESIYKACLLIELEAAGYHVETNRRLRLIYKGHELKYEFCPDLIVNGVVVVELKAVEQRCTKSPAATPGFFRCAGTRAPCAILCRQGCLAQR